jgi:hypothetical protein
MNPNWQISVIFISSADEEEPNTKNSYFETTVNTVRNFFSLHLSQFKNAILKKGFIYVLLLKSYRHGRF